MRTQKTKTEHLHAFFHIDFALRNMFAMTVLVVVVVVVSVTSAEMVQP